MPDFVTSIEPFAAVKTWPPNFAGPLPSPANLARSYLETDTALAKAIAAAHGRRVTAANFDSAADFAVAQVSLDIGPNYSFQTNAVNYIKVYDPLGNQIGHTTDGSLRTQGNIISANIEFPLGSGNVFACCIRAWLVISAAP